jgi:hypothetical protein
MQAGDNVKVRIQNEGFANHRWVTGKVLGLRSPERRGEPTIIKVGHGEYSSYVEQEFPATDVKRYTPLADERHVANFERDLPIGLVLAQTAIADLLPGETVTLKVSDQSISGYHGAVTLDPVVFEQETIGGFIERTGYQVTVWKHIPASRVQPDEYVAPVGTYPNIGVAVQEFINTIFKVKATDYWQAKADEAMAAQWEEDNAGGEAYIGGIR